MPTAASLPQVVPRCPTLQSVPLRCQLAHASPQRHAPLSLRDLRQATRNFEAFIQQGVRCRNALCPARCARGSLGLPSLEASVPEGSLPIPHPTPCRPPEGKRTGPTNIVRTLPRESPTTAARRARLAAHDPMRSVYVLPHVRGSSTVSNKGWTHRSSRGLRIDLRPVRDRCWTGCLHTVPQRCALSPRPCADNPKVSVRGGCARSARADPKVVSSPNAAPRIR